jgi:fatty acid desaturase
LQVSLAVITMHWSWPSYLAVVYVVGATANHSLFLAIHELSHNLGFKSIQANKLCAMLANLPIGIPYCITFKPYHMEHHRFQGDHGEPFPNSRVDKPLLSSALFSHRIHAQLKSIVTPVGNSSRFHQSMHGQWTRSNAHPPIHRASCCHG